MGVRIIDARESKEIFELFVGLPGVVYREDSRTLSAPREAVLNDLQRTAFERAQHVLVALEDERPVGRVVAWVSQSLRDERGRPFGVLGFFEALNRPAAARALLDVAADRLRSGGGSTILGPVDGDTWHRYRLNVGPYDDPPFFMEPCNPDYYPSLWERAGFNVVERYHTKRVEDMSRIQAGYEPAETQARSRGYTFRLLEPNRLLDELGILYELSCRIFRGNFLYTDISKNEFLALYTGVEALLEPGLVWFAQAPDQSYAGFVFAYPNRFPGARDTRSQGRTDTINIKTLGVVKEHQRLGVGAALIGLAYRAAHESGYTQANLCLMREGNPSSRLEGGIGRITRRYHLYQRMGA